MQRQHELELEQSRIEHERAMLLREAELQQAHLEKTRALEREFESKVRTSILVSTLHVAKSKVIGPSVFPAPRGRNVAHF
jgi:hypothetical protein